MIHLSAEDMKELSEATKNFNQEQTVRVFVHFEAKAVEEKNVAEAELLRNLRLYVTRLQNQVVHLGGVLD